MVAVLIERLPDRSLVFCCTWREFLQAWRQADQAHRVVLPDGRPAARTDGEGEVPPSYTSLHPHVWPVLRARLKEAFALVPPSSKRVRLCEACRSELKVSREESMVWHFKCETCGSIEIYGKDFVGGTPGAGEKERP